jgi:phage terminase small subunit
VAKPRIKPGTSKGAAIERRQAFVNAYLTNGRNGTQAAITAGFSAKTAHVTASQLLKDPKIAAQVQERVEQLQEVTGLSVERTLLELARIAYFDPRKTRKADGSIIPLHELDDATAAAIASEEFHTVEGKEGKRVVSSVSRKFWDKNSALEKAMRYHGLFEKDNMQRGPDLALQVVLIGPP